MTETAKPAKKTAAKKAETAEARKARLEEKAQREAEARDERIREDLAALEATVTQREWLLICRRLDVTRQRIDEDYGVRVLALAWVRQKRTHGGAEWDKLLDMTDEQLADVLLATDDPPKE